MDRDTRNALIVVLVMVFGPGLADLALTAAGL